jgi:hypothetical protein
MDLMHEKQVVVEATRCRGTFCFIRKCYSQSYISHNHLSPAQHPPDRHSFGHEDMRLTAACSLKLYFVDVFRFPVKPHDFAISLFCQLVSRNLYVELFVGLSTTKLLFSRFQIADFLISIQSYRFQGFSQKLRS